MKIINHHSKAETISKLTVPSQLLQIYFSPAKVYILEMTKLGKSEDFSSKGSGARGLPQPVIKTFLQGVGQFYEFGNVL